MVTDDLPNAFEQLVVFGQRPDMKIRPVLLRVLVDMFVGKSNHTETELRQFGEMMAHLLDDADDDTRLAVAEKLAVNPHTPEPLLQRFVAERGTIAAKVLSKATLDASTLNAAAVFGTPAMAAAVARRDDLDPTITRNLAERPEPEVLLALADNATAPIGRPLLRFLARRAQDLPALAASLLARDQASGEATPLFLGAGPAQRREIIAAARRQDLGQIGRARSAPAAVDTMAAIERASFRFGLEGLDVALAMALDMSPTEVGRLIEDRHGEPLALLFAALEVDAAVATRAFILGEASVGHSFPRVSALVNLVETVPARVAYKLVMQMLGRMGDAPRRPALPAQGPYEAQTRRADAKPARAEAPALPGRATRAR